MIHFALLVAGVWANFRDPRMLALTFVVAASVFVPVPKESYEAYYDLCILGELIVAGAATCLRTPASGAIAALCALLVLSHVLGYHLDGSPPLSPYRILVKIFEHAEMVACIILSNPLRGKLRNT